MPTSESLRDQYLAQSTEHTVTVRTFYEHTVTVRTVFLHFESFFYPTIALIAPSFPACCKRIPT